jgi:HK97 family phage major capsid protein
MSNDTLTAVELLKDGNDRFIFREDVNGEFDGYILGYPVEVSDNMDEIGSGKDVAFFGDFSGLALKQRADALELQVLREKYATEHAIGVCAWLEFDAKVEHKQKIAKLTMGA